MAKEEKTEEATTKKKKESRDKGQIAKSQDLSAWMAVLVGLYLIPLTVRRLADVTAGSMYEIRELSSEPAAAETVAVLGAGLLAGFLAAAPLMLVAMAVALGSTLGQVGFLLSFKPLKPDFKRVNPKSGLQRIFSPRSVWETVKQLLKISVVIGVAWPEAMQMVEDLSGRGRLALTDGLGIVGDGVLGLVQTVALTLVILSFADYGYQRYQNKKDMRMTKKEVKDEFKNAEGDGSVKGKMRQLARSMAANRMIADVSDANVIITNPTHIAVALQYDPERGGAPKVLAVGAGSVAAKIRDAGEQAGVPRVEAKPLARALWRACDVGDEVPILLYEAVAKVLVFVRQLDRRKALKPVDLPKKSRVDDELLDSIPRKKRRRR